MVFNLGEETMTALSKFKLVSAQADRKTPISLRRAKLTGKIEEQIAYAKAVASGDTFSPTRKRVVKDAETGLKKHVETAVTVKPWWWTGQAGNVILALRYGSKPIEIAKGKNAFEVGSMDELVPALLTLREAVKAGELDTQIESASNSLRAGFGKKKAAA
jgi:hypothetical protein